MNKKETIEQGDIIEITSCRYSIDWTYDDKHKINLKDIFGFELHWRSDNWHVVVVTRQKTTDDKYYTYELSDWVPNSEIRKLLNNPKAMIKRIVNYHSSKNFIKEMQDVILPKH